MNDTTVKLMGGKVAKHVQPVKHKEPIRTSVAYNNYNATQAAMRIEPSASREFQNKKMNETIVRSRLHRIIGREVVQGNLSSMMLLQMRVGSALQHEHIFVPHVPLSRVENVDMGLLLFDALKPDPGCVRQQHELRREGGSEPVPQNSSPVFCLFSSSSLLVLVLIMFGTFTFQKWVRAKKPGALVNEAAQNITADAEDVMVQEESLERLARIVEYLLSNHAPYVPFESKAY